MAEAPNKKTGHIKKADYIEGDKIILYDKNGPNSKLLKRVEIITPTGEKRHYEIRKTKKGGYLFN